MEMVKKFGLWVVAAVIAIAAIAVYFLFVHPVAAEVGKKRAEIEKRGDELRSWAQKGKDIPNPTRIEDARKTAEQVAAVLDQCEFYLAQQPRRAHTIRFFIKGPFGQETEVPLEHAVEWLTLYRQYNWELQNQITEAGMSYTISTMDWGTSVPTPEGIAAAMELYWFQKDLVDFLTQQVEKDFAAYLEFKAKDRADPFPAKPFDLVVNRSPARLDEFLRTVSREKLVAVLSAIVVNRQQQDLFMIFNTLLPDKKNPDGTIEEYGFPWERPASEKEHRSVRGFTMDEAQEKFLAEMLPPGTPDLSNRQRFLDYVMELRMVRYRADVIGLLESHGFKDLATSLRRGTEAELNGILNDIADVNGFWTATRIAEAISAIVSINNENDFLLVRNNHAPNIVALLNMTIGAPDEKGGLNPTGRPGRPGRPGVPEELLEHIRHLRERGVEVPELNEAGAAAGGQPTPSASAAPGKDLYKPRTFEMKVKLEFGRVPVFLRRLISNSWRYRVRIRDITLTEATISRSATSSLPGMLSRDMMRGLTLPATRAGAPPASGQPKPETVEAGNYVILSLDGEGYQFTPLVTKYRDKLENRAMPAAPAPAGGPATPTGAR
jgi:hypothetical protein